jgi:hypothetical protein
MKPARSSLPRTAFLIALLILGALTSAGADELPTVYRGTSSPAAEFGAPYAIRVLQDGSVVEISGSFSWALPQNFMAILAQSPRVRTIRLESPGGFVQPAIAVANIIVARGLDTYVGRFCASACTLAFLGGQHRFIAPNARLGFHQAYAPNVPAERINPMMRQAYSVSGVPASFIDHVLRTPPRALWFPSQTELRDASIITGPPPPALLLPEAAPAPEWADTIQQLRWASDGSLVQFAAAATDLLTQLQTAGSEMCWEYTHHIRTDLAGHVRRETLDALAEAMRRVRDDTEHAPAVGLDAAEKARVLAGLVAALPPGQRTATVAAMRPAADHAAFCPALRTVLNAALALPDANRGAAVRALLSGG